MISILIPVYNCNIVILVQELHRQASNTSVPFEIIVLDDYSSELLRDQNKELEKLPHVKIQELDKNIGRARIRNRLAAMAQYSSLLFMDCDSEVSSGTYIEQYLPYCSKEVVVCGGRVYSQDPPDDPEYMLRWLYGLHREQIPASVRNQNPYSSFMTNNFLIPRMVLSNIQFDESIVQYGHEDTLFGFELKKKGIPVVHIDNPLLHTGLEIAAEFLRKTTEGIENLHTLVKKGKIERQGFQEIRLLKAYNILSKYRFVNLYLFLYGFILHSVTRNLLGSNPSMLAFDLYKLSVLSKRIKRDKENKQLFE